MLTEASREQTHAEACLEESFATTPFRLGWQAHCRCDLVQAQIHARLWPAAAALPEPDHWIAMSAAKMVQDEADSIYTPFMAHLDVIAPVETPFDEEAAAILRFYRLIHEVYSTTGITHGERFARLWAGVGLEDALIDKLLSAYENLKADNALAERIAGSMAPLLTASGFTP